MGRERPIRVGEVGETGQVQQEEAELEGAPRVLLGDVELLRRGRSLLRPYTAPAHGLCVEDAHALKGHGSVREAKGGGGLRVAVQQGNAGADALKSLPAIGERSLCRVQVGEQ
jgi:hypothetical protein